MNIESETESVILDIDIDTDEPLVSAVVPEPSRIPNIAKSPDKNYKKEIYSWSTSSTSDWNDDDVENEGKVMKDLRKKYLMKIEELAQAQNTIDRLRFEQYGNYTPSEHATSLTNVSTPRTSLISQGVQATPDISRSSTPMTLCIDEKSSSTISSEIPVTKTEPKIYRSHIEIQANIKNKEPIKYLSKISKDLNEKPITSYISCFYTNIKPFEDKRKRFTSTYVINHYKCLPISFLTYDPQVYKATTKFKINKTYSNLF